MKEDKQEVSEEVLELYEYAAKVHIQEMLAIGSYISYSFG